MRLKALAALLFLAGDLAAATPISCSEVRNTINHSKPGQLCPVLAWPG